jgi:hypothetical protein
MKDRGIRRQTTEKVIYKRLKLVKSFDPKHYEKMKAEPHRVAKQHPFDCGNPKCGLCHSDKLSKKPKKPVVIGELEGDY